MKGKKKKLFLKAQKDEQKNGKRDKDGESSEIKVGKCENFE